jgi:8-oxo-dGTP pyrophosphatase MutT (NUDIX family)
MTPSVAEVFEEVAAHSPRTPRETTARDQILRYLDWLAAPFDPTADPVHVTGSAIVLDGEGRVLLHRHKRLGRWLQPGGHVDPGEDPRAAAWRETREETGLALTAPADPAPLIHVDVHWASRGHLHLDLRYLLLADPQAPFAPAPGESRALRWVPVEGVEEVGDASVTDAVDAAARRIAASQRPTQTGTASRRDSVGADPPTDRT